MAKAVKEEAASTVAPHYEEWKVQISFDEEKKSFVPEKLKLNRPKILISEEQAEILNDGVLKGGNTFALMYFLPE